MNLPGVNKCVSGIVIVIEFIVDGLVANAADTKFRITIVIHNLSHCGGHASGRNVVVAVEVVLVLRCVFLCGAEVVEILSLIPLGGDKGLYLF